MQKPDRRGERAKAGELAGEHRFERLVDLGIGRGGIVHHRQGHAAEIGGIDGQMRAAGACGIEGRRSQQPQKARAGAAAIFMIAAHQYDRRGGKQGRGGGEEIRRPARPVVAPGRPGAARIAGRTGRFTIQIIPQMNDEIGLELAAAAATDGNGQFSGSLQACRSEPLMRQPVSPRTRMRCGCAFGSGKATPATEALVKSMARGAAQSSGNSGSRFARGVIAISPLSVTTAGHDEFPLTKRASKPPPATACTQATSCAKAGKHGNSAADNDNKKAKHNRVLRNRRCRTIWVKRAITFALCVLDAAKRDSRFTVKRPFTS